MRSRAEVSLGLLAFLLVLGTWGGGRAAWADPEIDLRPPPVPTAPDTPALQTMPVVPDDDTEPDTVDVILEEIEGLERAGKWSEAIERYEDLRETEGALREIVEGLERCRGHLRVEARCQNADSRDYAQRLTATRGVALYEELLDRIGTSYVTQLEPGPLVARGLSNCLLAAQDAVFLRAYRAAPAPETAAKWVSRVTALKAECAGRALLPAEAAQVVRRMLRVNAETAGLPDGPLILEMIQGAVEGLDPYSAFLDPARLKGLRTEIEGEFVGVGIRIAVRGGGLEVSEPVSGGPAAKAGVRAGDRLLAIDGHATEGLGLDEAARLLRGPVQSAVVIEVQHEGQAAPVVLTIPRERVVLKSVTDVRFLGQGRRVGYLRLTSFQKNTPGEVEEALKELQTGKVAGLVLDLRGNPGGVVDVAVDVANLFIERGVVVTTRGRAFGQSWTFRARPEGTHVDLPLVLLVDELSASASEIVAGALSDHHRATLLGTQTYGKGSVQSLFTLGKGDVGLRLTTARFYIPSGRTFDGTGLTPDVEVRLPKTARQGEVAAEGETRDTQLTGAVQYLEARLLAGAASRPTSE